MEAAQRKAGRDDSTSIDLGTTEGGIEMIAKRDELLKELNDWRSLDTFTAQEDVEYAQQRIAELTAEIKAFDAATPPGHVCCKCRRTDTSQDSFLGFHAFRHSKVCDDCAHTYGCNCCQAINDYVWGRILGQYDGIYEWEY